MGRQLLEELRAAGERGLELDRLRIAGAAKELGNMVRLGYAIALDGKLFYAAETYHRLARAILKDLEAGASFSIAQTKERTGLSRKYIIPLLNRLEADGYVRREGNLREVIREAD